jgi:hypothetical protein
MAGKETQAATVTVKMDDGREVEFAGKRKMIKSSLLGEEATQVRLDFSNGETRTFTVPDSLYAKFAAHGAEQKLGDEIAGIDDVEDCIFAVDALIERLDQGEWGVKRESNGMAGTSVLCKALIEHTGKHVTSIKEFLKSKSQQEKVALRSHPVIKPIIDRIESEKTTGKTAVDTEKLLSELA